MSSQLCWFVGRLCRFITFIIVICLSIVTVACSGSSGGKNPGNQEPNEQQDPDGNKSSVKISVDQKGGLFEFPASGDPKTKITFKLEANAISEAQEIHITFAENYPEASYIFKDAAFDLQPNDFQFASPLTVGIFYDTDLLSGLPESALRIYVLDDGQWKVLASNLDESAHNITVNVSRLGIFALGTETIAPQTAADPAGGIFTSLQTVTLSCSDEGGAGCSNIFYTLDGTEPDETSNIYFEALALSNENTTLRYFAVDKAGNKETSKTQIYEIQGIATYKLGGNVQGLSGVLQLQLNQSEMLQLTGNGNFEFVSKLLDGATFQISIAGQPDSQNCVLSKTAGNVIGVDVSDINIECTTVTQTYTLGGEVSGLNGSNVVLENNGVRITVGKNGSFIFAGTFPDDTAYAVSIYRQPFAQTCSLQNETGKITTANVSNIQVFCQALPNNYKIGGQVDGLIGTLVLQNGDTTKTITQNGTYAFETLFLTGDSYDIKLISSPEGQDCNLSNATGSIENSNVPNVNVSCVSKLYALGGAISGVTGTLKLSNSDGQSLNITQDADFVFANLIPYGTNYTISVSNVPTGYDCQLQNNKGVIGAQDILNIVISCAVDTTPPGTPDVSHLPFLFPQSNRTNNPKPTWKWVSGGEGDGIYRYKINDNDWSGEVTFTYFTPDSDLNDGEYTLYVQERDNAGNWSAVDSDLIVIETVPPEVVDTWPPVNGKAVNPNTVVNATISERFVWYLGNLGAKNYNFMKLEDSQGHLVTADMYLGSEGEVVDGLKLELRPRSPLAINETYKVTVTLELIDYYGNKMVEPYVWHFTTREPLPYYEMAGNWNDYLLNDADSPLALSGAVCGNDLVIGKNACIHAGMMRKFLINGQASCTSLTANDELNVFQWHCLDQGEQIYFVSTDMQSAARLADLVQDGVWKKNSLQVNNTKTQSLIFQSVQEVWWSNPIVMNPVVAKDNTILLDTSGTVYVFDQSVNGKIGINADSVALVVMPDTELGYIKNKDTFISAQDRRFIWIEGKFNGYTAQKAIAFSNVDLSVLRHVTTYRAYDSGILLSNGSDMNHLYDVKSYLNSRGMRLNQVKHNVIENSLLTMNSITGLDMQEVTSHQIHQLMSSSNALGVKLVNSNSNLFVDVTATHNAQDGFQLSNNSSNNTLLNLSINNNAGAGLRVEYAADKNFIMNANLVNNGNSGLIATSVSSATINNLLATNNGPAELPQTPANVYGVYLDNSSFNFYGEMRLGSNQSGDCHVITDTLITEDCQILNTAQTIFDNSYSAKDSYLGKLVTDDVLNLSDSDGTAMFTSSYNTFDWVRFDSQRRSWGANEYASFQNGGATQILFDRGKPGCSLSTVFNATSCTANNAAWHANFSIWDWRLNLSDTVARSVLNARLSGDATNIISHTWQDSSSTVLMNAVEIMGDRDSSYALVGNENGLCESGEACFYTPNIASYQGDGELISAGTFVNGELNDIRLYKYQNNGVSME